MDDLEKSEQNNAKKEIILIKHTRCLGNGILIAIPPFKIKDYGFCMRCNTKIPYSEIKLIAAMEHFEPVLFNGVQTFELHLAGRTFVVLPDRLEYTDGMPLDPGNNPLGIEA